MLNNKIYLVRFHLIQKNNIYKYETNNVLYHRLKMGDNLENLSVSIENEKGEPIEGYFRLIFHLRKYAVSI